jgi:hypothetical protein
MIWIARLENSKTKRGHPFLRQGKPEGGRYDLRSFIAWWIGLARC